MTIGLLIIILGQNQEMKLILKKNDGLNLLIESHYDKFNKELSMKNSLEEMVAQMQNKVKELEAEVASSSSEVEMKKTNADTCETEMVRENKSLSLFIFIFNASILSYCVYYIAAEWLNWKNWTLSSRQPL